MTNKEPKSQTDLKINVEFYEVMPGRLNINATREYVKGVLELSDDEIIIHKKSPFLGRDRGILHIRYDNITSMDYTTKRTFALAGIQVYLINAAYLFRSRDTNLMSFYDMIRERVDAVQADVGKTLGNGDPVFSAADEIRKLAELRDKGILTEEEFKLKKKQILGI